MRSFFIRIWSIVRVAAKRLFAERGLASATTLGLITAVGLTMSIPFYADAVYFRILRETMLGEGSLVRETPLTFRFRYVGARDGTMQLEDVQPLNSYLVSPAFSLLRLPSLSFTYHYKTDIFRVYLPDVDVNNDKGLTYISLAIVNDMEKNVLLKEGKFPSAVEPGATSTIDVLVHEKAAADMQWHVGDTYLIRQKDILFPIRISGIWTPVEPLAKFWSSPQEELALVPEETFANRISPYMKSELYLGVWQMVANGGNLHIGDIGPLLTRIEVLQKQASANLPKVAMDVSPVSDLKAYQKGVPGLTFQLLAYSVPIIVLLLAFIGLVVGLYVDQQRNQIAVLRSRGATRWQVVGIAALEGMILGMLALFFGTVLGMTIARLIGRARSFLIFTAPPDLRVSLTPQTLAVGIVAVLLAFLAQILPTLSASGHTILTYKQERARMLRPPWWQRIWLDVILLIPTGYGFYMLQKQGSLAAEGGKAVADLFQNPVLFLTPALGLFALTLFLARLLPLVMAILAWIASRTDSIGMLLASRQLSRSPAIFTAPLMLLTLTLSLSGFTASLAETLDGHLTKQVYYKVGADLRLEEEGLSTGIEAGGNGSRWFFRPVESHLKVEGVKAAMRLGRYRAFVPSNIPVEGTFIGIDRLTFPNIAYWQRDFADQSLGAMMNQLALTPGGIYVTQAFLDSQGLKVGDPFRLMLNTYEDTTLLELQILGVVKLFSTWYPENGPLFVGNLDYYYQAAGIEYPYEVWLKTDPGADQRHIVATVRGLTALLDIGVDTKKVVEDGLNIFVNKWDSARLQIFAEQRQPQRQGLFGLLSVGFIASALLTVLGFLLYALFSFRRRFIELGVLRAVGLSTAQMTLLLAWELASLILVGMVAGTVLGVWVSAWFIPYLQVGIEASARIPPFVVAIAWNAIVRIYILFGILFMGALGGLTALLVRMKIFQAVKLGETA